MLILESKEHEKQNKELSKKIIEKNIKKFIYLVEMI